MVGKFLSVCRIRQFKTPGAGSIGFAPTPVPALPPLITEVQPELHLAHGCRRGDLPGPGDVDCGIGIRQVDMVGRVVILPLELERLSLCNREYLPQGKIEIVQPGTTERIVPDVPVAAGALRRGEGRGIEP